MDTKSLERNIKQIIKTGEGYSADFIPVLRETKNILKRINKGRPTAENYFQLGTLCISLEDNILALEAFKTGYRINKNHFNCGTYSALLFEQKEQWQEALVIYKELNDLDPGNIHIAERMLLLLHMQNDIKQVLTLCYYFLEKKLYYPAIYEYISRAYYECGNIDKAIEHLNNALTLDKENYEYKSRIIHHYYKNKDYQSIMKYEEYVLSDVRTPLHTKLIYANTLAQVGKIAEARSQFASLLKETDDRYQVLAEIALFHATFELNAKRALFINKYILNRDPLNIQVLTNQALMSDKEYSLAAYKKVLELCPNEHMFRMNYGHRLLQHGDLEEGFKYYESRVEISQPHLSGQLSYPASIKDKKVFIWREQGIGDQYMWSWLFKLLERDNIQAKIGIDERLLSLMKRSFPRLEFTGKEPFDIYTQENLELYDAQMIIHSTGKYYIPEIFNAQRMFENGQFSKGHIKVNQEKVAYWKQRIKKFSAPKAVGVCWRSSLSGDMRDYAYLTVENIVQIFKDIECSIINLQYDCTDAELQLLQSELGERFINFSDLDLKDDQEEVAALISAVDLVFTVATAVMALAGAIGKNTLCPGNVASLGKPFNIMIPTVKSIAGPEPIRENSERQTTEILKALEES